MSFVNRLAGESPSGRLPIRNIVIGVAVLILLVAFWPLRTVPTGSRGVITVGGAIRGLQGEGFT
ncbi:MAG: hypothetical protein ABJD97_12030, partial [Betaproteobacteria bacterium]